MASPMISKQQAVQEILKCGKDQEYFVNNFCRIPHSVHGLVRFDTYDFQDQLLEDLEKHRFNVVLKARQMGISTIVAAHIAWLMIFHKHKNVLILCTKLQTATNLVKKVKEMVKNLPEWMQIAKIIVDNRTSFELSNGSQIKASSTSGDAGRSEALSLLVLDEAAFIPDLDEIWTGIYPTISTGGRCIALSTPNGVGNWFHTAYVDSESGVNMFYPTKLHWSLHPDRDMKWFEVETRNLSKRQIAQEYECNFNASGETVIAPESIEHIEKTVCAPKHKVGFDRNYWIWEECQDGKKYLLVADVARGDGADYSVFHVIETEDMQIVAEYKGKPNIDDFANILFSAGREYDNCMLVVENNNIGYSVLEKLINLEYPNVFHSVKGTNELIDQVAAIGNPNAVPGFTTSMKSRPLIIAKLEEFIRNKLITIRSLRLLNELKTFIWYHGKPQAMKGYNDDLVIALAIACWVRDTAIIASRRGEELQKAMLSSMVYTRTLLNTNVRGQHGYDKNMSAFTPPDDRGLEQHKEDFNKFGWIFKG
tara:strand:- start:28 stop:1635 length:1608 start_codon:yes stop_codon:yes gene_type:complete